MSYLSLIRHSLWRKKGYSERLMYYLTVHSYDMEDPPFLSKPTSLHKHCNAIPHHWLREEVRTLKRLGKYYSEMQACVLYTFTSYLRKVVKCFGIVTVPSLKKMTESYAGISEEEWTHTQHTVTLTHEQPHVRVLHTHTHTLTHVKCSHAHLSINRVHRAIVYYRSYFCVSRSTFLLLIKMSRW